MLIVVSIMLMIFLFSSQNVNTSDSFSRKITGWIIPVIDKIVSLFPKGTFQTVTGSSSGGSFFDDLNHYVRKAAHVTEYAILGAAIMRFAVAVLKAGGKRLSLAAGFISFAVGVIYASTDEFHQLFVDGRGGRIKDVVIDSAGVFIGCTIVYIIYFMSTKKRRGRINADQDGCGAKS